MRGDTSFETNRGQAYTLEGFISAMVVLTALLLALQSVVITPTTGGLADRTVQEQIQQETQDALTVAAAADTEDLSYMARHWEENGGGEFEGADQSGPEGYDTYTTEAFRDRFVLGEILYDRFAAAGWSYNVELHYEDDTGAPANRSLVYQGSPPSDAVTASYTVALYENQQVTTSSSDTLDDAESAGWAPIPSDSEDHIYNVVEVRVIVW